MTTTASASASVASASASVARALLAEAAALAVLAEAPASKLGVGPSPTPAEEALRRLQYRRMASVLESVSALAETSESLWELRKYARMGVMTSSRLGGIPAVADMLNLVFEDDE